MSEYTRFRIDKVEFGPGRFRWELLGKTPRKGLFAPGQWKWLTSHDSEANAIAALKDRTTYPVVRDSNHYRADGSRDMEDFAW
jgi:hypothetical protein